MKPTKNKEGRAKAWAVVSYLGVSTGELKIHESYHVFSVHPTKERAKKDRPFGWRMGNKWKVIPATITYTLPTPKGKKRGVKG